MSAGDTASYVSDDGRVSVSISPLPLATAELCASVVCAEAGAVSTFVGTTRDTFKGKRVLRLSYEAYVPMALRKLRQLAEAMRAERSVSRVCIAHRTGDVAVAEASVVIAASSPHRREAIDAVGWAIDELKRTVPIWKREWYDDGSCWKENADFRRDDKAVLPGAARAAAD